MAAGKTGAEQIASMTRWTSVEGRSPPGGGDRMTFVEG